jgi:membrane protease YdiL (CAAX protease family)
MKGNLRRTAYPLLIWFAAWMLFGGWLFYVFCIAVFGLLWYQDAAGHPGHGFVKPHLPRTILTILGFAALNIAFVMVSALFYLTRFFPSYEQVAEFMTDRSLLRSLLIAGIAAPILEELLFRGIVLRRLLAWTPPWAAILVSSALFGMIHMNLFQGLYAFIAGALLAVLYVRTKSLWYPVVGHMAFNITNILLIERFAA